MRWLWKKAPKEKEIVTVTAGELSSQRIITVRQFVDDGYEAKVKRGECEVFYILGSPTLKHGNAERVHSVEDKGGYYRMKVYKYPLPGAGIIMVTGDTQLICFTQNNFQQGEFE